MKEKEETVRVYNRHASKMAKKFNKIGPRSKDIKIAFSFTKKENPKVLEIGCGNGRDASEIIKFTNDYTGVDISKSMITLACKFLPKVRFEVADMENFNFPKNLDIIFAFASMLHLSKKSFGNVLKKAHQSFNNAGVFYISLKQDRYHKEIKKDKFGKRLFYFYEENDLRKLSLDNNFDIVFVNKQNILNVEWIDVVLQKK